MDILIGCESSGVSREAYRRLGHNAYSCDLLPADDGSPYHLQGDLFSFLTHRKWDLLQAHPPCTYLTCSAEWAYADPDYDRFPDVGYHQKVKPDTLTGEARRAARDEAVAFFLTIAMSGIPHICIENPVGVMSSRWRKADQYVQPYLFGDDASKNTGLWLVNLPPLTIKPENRCAGRIVTHNGKQVERWANQTDSGQNRLSPSADRWKDRSKTYSGIADAFATQFTNHLALSRRI